MPRRNSHAAPWCIIFAAMGGWRHIVFAHIFAHVRGLETSTAKVVARLRREGWESRPGGRHDVFKHPFHKGRIIVPRHRTLSPGVAREIAKVAGWMVP